MRLRIKIVGGIPPEARGSSVRARFAPDAAEDAEGQGFRGGWLKPVEGEDAEGQGYRNWLKPAEDEDAEGQGYRNWLKPAEDEDAEGQGYRYGGFLPVGDDEAAGSALTSHVLEIERDDHGELVGRYVPARDDTEGQGYRYN